MFYSPFKHLPAVQQKFTFVVINDSSAADEWLTFVRVLRVPHTYLVFLLLFFTKWRCTGPLSSCH